MDDLISSKFIIHLCYNTKDMRDEKKHVEEKELEMNEQETQSAENETAQNQQQTAETDTSAAASAQVDYKEKYLRLLSEFTQYQRQKEEEVKAMAVYGNKSLLLKMIDLLDDMEMGLMQEGLSEETKSLLEMLKSKFENTLNVEGVKEISIKSGDQYDAQKCEVISAVEDENNKGKIIHVVRKGYMLSDRVLRTAKVIVGK
jgi:molecular chaperone GrpE